jgi:hypothetical protein
MMNRLLLGSRKRKALKTMRTMVLPIVASLQKPGHSIPLDVLLDPLVLGYIRTYSQIAIHQAIDESIEKERMIFAAILEQFFTEIAGSDKAGKEMVRALVNYSDSSNADLWRGGDLATKHWVVLNGSKMFDDDPDVVRAFQHAHAMLEANTSAFGANDDKPQHAAARVLHAQLLHHVSAKYGVENPDWRQWVRGW